MPLPSRLRRALVPVAVGAAVAVLAACGVARTEELAARPTAVAAVHRQDATRAVRVVDDERSASTTVVPVRANGALVVFLHGWAQNRRSFIERRSTVADALTDAGFTVLAADARLQAWGDAASVADYRALIERTARRYGLRDVFLIGESMGGLATMQLAGTMPSVRAVTAWYPVCDLRTMTQDRFRASIDAAWLGADRLAVSPVAVSAKPLMIWASDADTVVAAATNAAVCAAAAKRAGAAVTYLRTSGEHGDPSNFDAAAIVAFFEQHRTHRV